MNGRQVTGEADVRGGSFDARRVVSGIANRTSWSGVSWSGVSWSGVSWSGTDWS